MSATYADQTCRCAGCNICQPLALLLLAASVLCHLLLASTNHGHTNSIDYDDKCHAKDGGGGCYVHKDGGHNKDSKNSDDDGNDSIVNHDGDCNKHEWGKLLACIAATVVMLGVWVQSALSCVDVLASFAAFSQSQLAPTCRPHLLPPGDPPHPNQPHLTPHLLYQLH